MHRLLLCALYGMSLTGCVTVNGGGRPMGSIIGKMDTTPQPGDWCRVILPEQRQGWYGKSQSLMTGRVEAVSEQEVVLAEVVVESRSQSAPPVVSRLPYFSRLFKNTGIHAQTNGTRTFGLDEFERLYIISEREAQQARATLTPMDHSVAQQLVAAVPGRR